MPIRILTIIVCMWAAIASEVGHAQAMPRDGRWEDNSRAADTAQYEADVDAARGEQPASSRARVQLPSHAIEVGGGEQLSMDARAPAHSRDAGVALPPRETQSSAAGKAGQTQAHSPAWTVLSALAVVIGLLMLLVWAARRSMPAATAPLSSDIIQVLGRSPLAHRQNMHLVRVGNRLLLLCVTAQGAETLTEITDPAEVERLCAACERSRPGSISATFRNVLAQVGAEPAAPGFLGRETVTPRKLARQTS